MIFWLLTDSDEASAAVAAWTRAAVTARDAAACLVTPPWTITRRSASATDEAAVSAEIAVPAMGLFLQEVGGVFEEQRCAVLRENGCRWNLLCPVDQGYSESDADT